MSYADFLNELKKRGYDIDDLDLSANGAEDLISSLDEQRKKKKAEEAKNESKREKRKNKVVTESDDIAPDLSGLDPAAQVGAAAGQAIFKWFNKDSEDDRTWFQKGGKTTEDKVVGTTRDAGTDLTAGLVGIGEKIIDWGASIAPLISKGQYYANGGGYNPQADKIFEESNKKFQDEVIAPFVKKDLYDEQKVAKRIVAGLESAAYLHNINQSGAFATPEQVQFANQMRGDALKYMATDENGFSQMEADSVLGDKSDALIQSAGQLAGTSVLAMAGVPWYLTTGASTWGAEAENALNQGATLEEANLSGMISAGAEILTEKISGGIKIPGIGKTADDAIVNALGRNISNKVVRTLAKMGVDMAGEGSEEVLSGVISALGQKLTYASEKEWEELFSKEDAWEAFIGGAVLGGGGSVTSAVQGKINGVDSVTNMTENEQKVFDKVYQDEIAKKEEGGEKLSSKEKAKIYDQIREDMEKGRVDTDLIESVLGGDSFSKYDSLVKESEEYDTLYNTEGGKLSEKQKDRLAELKAKNSEKSYKEAIAEAKGKLSSDVFGISGRFAESYREKERRSEDFVADYSKIDGAKHYEAAKKTIENAIKAGANNTNRVHDLVDLAAKVAGDSGKAFVFQSNEQAKADFIERQTKLINQLSNIKNRSNEQNKKLAELKQTLEDVKNDKLKVNGNITDDGIVLNLDAGKPLNRVVGHEVTHIFEGKNTSKEYSGLKDALYRYAKAKGVDVDTKLSEYKALYEGVKDADAEAEMIADMVGDYLFEDTDFVSNLSTNKDVFHKVWDEIKHLWNVATAGSHEKRELERVKKAFEDAYAKMGEGVKNVGENTKYDLENGRKRKYNKHSRYNESETLFLSWSNGSAPIGEVKKFNRFGKMRYYEKTAEGCVELSRRQYSERGGVDAENAYRRAEREISETFNYDESTQRGLLGDYHGNRDPGGAAAVFGQTFREELSNDTAGSERSLSGYDGRNGINQTEYNSEASDNSGASFVTFSNDYKTIRNYMKDGDIPTKYSMTKDSNGRDLATEQMEFFKDSKAVDADGNLKVLFHGTATGEFTIFDKSKGSVEGDFGSGFYFTDNGNDVENNYEGGGPDFENKVARLAERIEADEDIDYDEAEKRARAELYKGSHKFEVYLNIKNPATVGETILFDPDEYFAEYDQDDYDSEEDYESDVEQLISDKIDEILWDVERNVDVYDMSGVGGVLWEAINEGGIGVEELKKKINDLYLEDSDGNIVGNEVTRQIIESLGYDGIIDPTVSTKWNMEMDEGTTHYIVFKPHQIKNVTNQEPTTNPDIRYSLTKDTKQEAYHDYLDAVNKGDTDTAQKLMDNFAKDAGYNYRGVHRSFSEFTVFDRSKIGSNAGTRLGDGFYVTIEFKDDATQQYADSAYGENRMDLYVKMESPLVLGSPIDENIVNKMEEDFSEFGWFGDDNHSYYAVTPEKIKKIFQSNDGYEQMETIRLIANRNHMEISELLKQYGFDSVIDENDYVKQAVVFDESQLKSAEPITYDEYGDVIMPYERFDQNNMDIRYSVDGNEPFNPFGSRDVFGKDFRKETEPLEDFAPIREDAENATVEGVAPDVGVAENETATEEYPRTRKALHESLVENIRGEFARRGADFDEALKKAKNLSTFATVDNTPQRVMEKSLGYKEGGILADLTVNKVAQNETEGIKWLNSYLDRKNGILAQLSKKYHIKPGSKEEAAVQMYAEGFYVNEQNEIIAYGDNELAKDFPDINVQRNIKALVNDPTIRKIYDETLDMINESRRRNLYPEIPRLDNYYLHYRAMDDTFSRLGLPFNPNDIRAKDLPTDLNGVTADLKPGQPYFASAKHREGKRTSFGVFTGLEKYLTSAKNQIFHIDDIQTLRALRNYLADTYGQANGLEGLDELTEEEAQERIKEVYSSHLSTFAKFLNEEANVLAGKTALIDRGIEGIIGRRGITFLDTINRQVGSNAVGYSVSSSLVNFDAIPRAFIKANKRDFVTAFGEMLINTVTGRSDGFAENSPVIIRRKGAERFHRTLWQKMSDPGYALMGKVDEISTELIARAKYNELTRKGMDAQKAHFETDKWVSKLMGDRSLGQQPQIFNSKMLGLLTKFQLEVRNNLDSMFYDSIQEAKVSNEHIQNNLERNARTAAKATAKIAGLAIAQHIFGKAFESVAGYNPSFDIIEAVMKAFGWDDEEEEPILDNLEEAFLTVVEDMPYSSVFTGGRIPIQNALPIKELVTGIDQYGNEKSRWETLGEIAPYYLMPGGYGQIKKTTQGLGMFLGDHPIDGSYTDSGNLRFPVDDTFGNVVQAGLFGQYSSKNARDYFDNNWAPLAEKQIDEYSDLGIDFRKYHEIREGLKDYDTLAEKVDYINGLDISDEQKNILVNNLTDRKTPIDMSNYGEYGSFEEFDYAQKNPDKYEFFKGVGISYDDYASADEEGKREYSSMYEWVKDNPGKYEMSKAISDDFLTYWQYKGEMGDLKADKDSDGKTISGSKKEKVIDYINNLDLDYGQKIILFRSMYDSQADREAYNSDILEYLNSRDDISYEEMVTILTELGFKVNGNQVTWD